MTRLLVHRLGLAAIGIVAFFAVESPHVGTRTFVVGMVALAVAVAGLVNWWMTRGVTDEAEKEVVAEKSFVTTKRILLAMMAIGIAAFIGGRATMATFTAETSNLGSTAASGTLTMSNTVGTGTACSSFGTGSNADNTNSSCSVPLTLQNITPGAFAGSPAKITLNNTGSLDARSLYLFAPQANTSLAAAVTSGQASSGATITTTPVEGTFNSGDTLTISYGQNSISCTVAGGAPVGAEGGATSVTLGTCTPATWNYSYPIGTRIIDTNSDTTTTNTDCYDAQTTSSTVTGASYGTQLNFNEVPPATTAHTTPTNGMCQQVLLWVQEQSSSGKNYCWYGNGSAGANGGCVAPISSTLTSPTSISGATTTLTVSALDGNVIGNAVSPYGDTITISQGNTSITCKATANAYIGDTSISVTSCGTYASFTSGVAKVTDTTTLTTLNSDTTHTISNFDTSAPYSTGKIPLYTVASNGTVNNPSAIELNKHGDSGDTRIFYVGVYLPATNGSSQNLLQGLKSTFGIAWHIDQ